MRGSEADSLGTLNIDNFLIKTRAVSSDSTSHNSGTYTVNDGWGNVGININSSYTDGGVDIG